MSSDGQYAKKLAEFKSQENPEAVLLVADAPDLIHMTVAWASTISRRRAKLTKPPVKGGTNAWWDWLWQNTEYSLPELVRKSDLSEFEVERRLRLLIENRIIYPDGTVNSFVQRFLRAKVLKLFQPKGQRTNAKQK
jgi:hypothetical protein